MRDNKRFKLGLVCFNILYELILLMLPFIHVLITDNTERVFIGYLCIPVTFLVIAQFDNKGKIFANPFTEVNPRKAFIVI
jgi:hypothetical protein